MHTGEKVRVARQADASAITETISVAFHDDPTWSWAFPDEAQRQKQYAIWWRFLLDGAMRFERPDGTTIPVRVNIVPKRY